MRHLPLRQLLPLRFPWRDDNGFTLLVDGAQFFPRMLDAIASAQHSICMELYLVGSGEVFRSFHEALAAAARRGVDVRLLLDHFGSLALAPPDREQLQRDGIELALYNPVRLRAGLRNLFRDHRKILVVDDVVAFTGGAGLTDEFLHGKEGQPPWHELMLEIRGPVVADWRLLFERGWHGLSMTARNQPAASHAPRRVGEQRGRVAASSGPRAHLVMQSLYRQLRQTRQRLWLVTPYFMPSWKLRRELIKARQRGVDTRILVPGPQTDHPALRQASHRFYARLLQHGVRIFEYQPRFIHAKVAVCDQWVSIGSTNFDRWNFHWNLDANQEIDDPAFLQSILAVLERDWADSMELDYATWQRRGWWWRLLENITGSIDRWLSRLPTKLGDND